MQGINVRVQHFTYPHRDKIKDYTSLLDNLDIAFWLSNEEVKQIREGKTKTFWVNGGEYFTIEPTQ